MLQKIHPQSSDQINGNNFVSKCFDKGNILRNKEFKCFFTLRDPRIPVSPKKTYPNFKVDEFFKHFNEVSLEAYDPGEFLVIDE